MKKITPWALVLGLLSLLSSCSSYYHYRMFNTDSSILIDSIERLRNSSTSEYKIEINDVISMDVFTNSGEKLVDPNNALTEGGSASDSKVSKDPIKYTVYSDGCAHLPMVGNVMLKGYTVFQADSIIASKFKPYYTDPYVKVTLLSKRVIVFGPDGGKIIPLEYQDMNLIEVIARYGGIKLDGKANNIRVVRGDLKNPDVQLINLNTIEGLRAAQTDMVPGDIVYIEPKRFILKETVTTIVPLVSLTISIVSLIVVFK
ncbi:polysaccharide biosynthesis/export family protein [Cytophaga aurantiaca]|uniref:polysaccharide biosynthesis/export family protein n=1 Tax=Cytophaga aurantiaca TaxID=29530 RepID=UPI00036D168A|nr:polysaccharide biosynthesis/export family protein [Cytophaga aurantiaca]